MPISRRRLFLAALFACALVAGPSPLAGAAQARANEYTLRVFITGSGSVQGSGIQCGAAGDVCAASYALGTTITIQETPAKFSVFAGWTGACTGVGNTCTITAGDPTTITATFAYIEVVDVNKLGDGQGTVESTPAGIDCGDTCSAPYSGSTPVTLTARPAPGSVFVGWGGYCKGTGACTVQQAYGTMPVTAEFRPKGERTSSGGSGGTGGTGGSGGTTINTSNGPFTAASMGASARKTASGRVITVRFAVSKPAAVRVQIWQGKKKLISEARLHAQAGPVTVKLPFSDGYKAGTYELWAYVTGPGEKHPKVLHWTVQVP